MGPLTRRLVTLDGNSEMGEVDFSRAGELYWDVRSIMLSAQMVAVTGIGISRVRRIRPLYRILPLNTEDVGIERGDMGKEWSTDREG